MELSVIPNCRPNILCPQTPFPPLGTTLCQCIAGFMCLEQTKFHNFAARPWRGASSHNFFTGAFPPAQMRGRSVQGLDAPVQLPSQLCQGTENTQQEVGPNKAHDEHSKCFFNTALFLQSCWEFGLLLAYSMHICDASPKHTAKHHISREEGTQSLCTEERFSKAGWGDYATTPSALSQRPVTVALSKASAD